ncbi:DUF3426 domain-containing protein [Rhodobacteraceae bacterium RKSG542]|uniref:DUF3426 domain-containing protein n=1 Tax=Pseudovibrio flavus TaxID=2529854 RepID=UPI0012BCE216|nr:DUF3426 domain-containing protein [Pseudovibrio flavus]MTI18429.1 DUF3426 domain-containing protein [Pseudovibrio flavus]
MDLDRQTSAKTNGTADSASQRSAANDDEIADQQDQSQPSSLESSEVAQDSRISSPTEPKNSADIPVTPKNKRESVKKSPSSRKSSAIRVRRRMGLALFVASLVLCFVTFKYRDELVRAYPELAELYQLVGIEINLRGLVFKDLRTFREYEETSEILVVEGTIENITGKTNPIPAVRLSLRSQDLQEIYAWTIEPKEAHLDPGATTRFRTRLVSPPERAADIQLRFVGRQDRRASIR